MKTVSLIPAPGTMRGLTNCQGKNATSQEYMKIVNNDDIITEFVTEQVMSCNISIFSGQEVISKLTTCQAISYHYPRYVNTFNFPRWMLSLTHHQ